MRLRVYPYKGGSRSAKTLAEGIGAKRLLANGRSRFVARAGDIVVNWGSSSLPTTLLAATILNKPEAIALASNKIRAFNTMQSYGVPVPRFTTSKSIMQEWVEEEEGRIVFCRTKLTGHSGEGIVVATCSDEVASAPLYTEGLDKKKEYRLHVVGDRVVDQQQKRKRSTPEGQETAEVDPHVWNHSTGRIYCRNNVAVTEEVKAIAVKAVKSLGLDFGAVDMVLDKEGGWWVLEVNTAAGLEGVTAETYIYNIKQLIGGIHGN